MHRLLPSLLLIVALLGGCLPQPTVPRESGKPTNPPPAAATVLPAAATAVAAVSEVPAAHDLRATEVAALPTLPPLPPSRPANLPQIALPDIPAALPPQFVVVEAGFQQLQRPDPPPPPPTLQTQYYAADLSDVALTVLLSDQQRARLAANGFVVSPGWRREFYEVYEDVRYNYQPVFVSSDAVLHSYHLAFSSVLRLTEQQSLAPLLARMDWQLLYTSLQYAEVLAGTPFEAAALRNAAYFAVPVALLTPDWQPPALIAEIVNADLQRILAAAGRSESAITGNIEDWTQFTPRGHYSVNDVLTRYFRAMIWHGRATLTLSSSDTAAGDLIARQMLLMTHALRYAELDGLPVSGLWQTIYDVTAFFVGESADLNPPELFQVLQQAYGDVGDVRQLDDAARIAHFVAGVRALTPVDEEPQLRLMGQRVVPDTDVFRALVAPQVPQRTLPRALDFFAALGSNRALSHLETSGETQYTNYLPQLIQQQQRLAGWSDDAWTRTLYRHWIFALRPLLDEPGEGFPAFMRSPAWLDKQLTTALGSWTELKHDTVLYAEQVFVEAGYGEWLFPPLPEPPPGYVEPLPQLYARVTALAEQTRDGLARRGLLADGARTQLERLAQLSERLRALSVAELSGQALTPDDHRYLRTIGRELEGLALASQSDDGFAGTGRIGDPPDVALVTDVASNVAGTVLHEGLGPVAEIFVIVPVDGRFVTARGAVYSHYEFEVAGQRLTNEQWRSAVDAAELPPRAGWAESFTVDQRPDDTLAARVIGFNDELVAAFFYGVSAGNYLREGEPTAFDIRQYLVGTELADTLSFLDLLQRRNQRIGMQRLSFEFVSFQGGVDNTATVTTRESWFERLYDAPDQFAEQMPPPIGERRYSVEATYSLERQDGAWRISRIVLSPEPPGWSTP